MIFACVDSAMWAEFWGTVGGGGGGDAVCGSGGVMSRYIYGCDVSLAGKRMDG